MLDSFLILAFSVLGSLSFYWAIPKKLTLTQKLVLNQDEISPGARKFSVLYRLTAGLMLSALAFTYVYQASQTLHFEF